MKTTITKKLLKESAAGGKGLVNAMFFALQRKAQLKQGIGDPEKAYLKQMTVTDKAEKKDPDPDNPSNAWAYYYMLYFGEERTGVEVDKKEFERAQPGMAYYVAFYSESDLAFSCFDVERYEPDPAMLR